VNTESLTREPFIKHDVGGAVSLAQTVTWCMAGVGSYGKWGDGCFEKH
jgi:hypothetical protein